MIHDLINEKKDTTDKYSRDNVKTSEIIRMSQDISGDWLQKIADKKIIAREQIIKRKDSKK